MGEREVALQKHDERTRFMRDRCVHANRLTGLPTSTFEVAQLCLDCGQFFAMVWGKPPQPVPTNDYYLQMAAAKLRWLAKELERVGQ